MKEDVKSPVIFMSIDGVLNSTASMLALGNPSYAFDQVSVRLVRRVCKIAKARIVLTSSWRTGSLTRTKADIERAAWGDEISEYVVGETRRTMRAVLKRRGEEIEEYVHEAKVGKYVVVDHDVSEMLPHQPVVRTHPTEGFRLKHYVDVLKILCDNVEVTSLELALGRP